MSAVDEIRAEIDLLMVRLHEAGLTKAEALVFLAGADMAARATTLPMMDVVRAAVGNLVADPERIKRISPEECPKAFAFQWSSRGGTFVDKDQEPIAAVDWPLLGNVLDWAKDRNIVDIPLGLNNPDPDKPMELRVEKAKKP